MFENESLVMGREHSTDASYLAFFANRFLVIFENVY